MNPKERAKKFWTEFQAKRWGVPPLDEMSNEEATEYFISELATVIEQAELEAIKKREAA